jgi:pimeloyl-ACP methyl ester carboxylesterase
MNMPVHSVSGVAAGVPYVALPPFGDDASALLVICWHLNDPPRSAAAMASALPLAGVAAWRVYLDLPMHGRRQLPGGLEEFMRLGYADAVLKAIEPQVTQAVAEFPAALDALCTQLPVDDGPIGLIGGSIGALPAQLVIAAGAARVGAAALVSPVIQLAEVVAANERRFGVAYPWRGPSRAIADRFDIVARAAAIAGHDPQPALLMITGSEDDPAFSRQVARLQSALRPRYRDPDRVAAMTIPGMGHAFADEPGVKPARQTAHGRLVDAAVTAWLCRHLDGRR